MNTETEYRREGSHLYKYDFRSNAYVHCYQNPRLSSLAALIADYERQCRLDEDFNIEDPPLFN